MTTIDKESVQHSIFMSALRRSMFPSVRSVIFDFQMVSSNSAGTSFNSS